RPVLRSGRSGWNGGMGGSIRCRFGGGDACPVRRRPGGGRVALKQAVNAWASAPEAEKAARFASAEAIRWLEWGMRSYENFALGLAVLLFAVAVVRTAWVPRPIAYLMGSRASPTWCRAGWPAPRDFRKHTRSQSGWANS